MKNRSKLRSCLLGGTLLLFTIVLFAWIGIILWGANFGPRKNIIRNFPNAKIHPSNDFSFVPGGILQLMMPEDFILPGNRAEVVVRGTGENVSFENLRKLNISYLVVMNCEITNWDNIVLNVPNDMYIYVTDSNFIGGDNESRRMLMMFRGKDSESGEIYYSFGNAP